MRRVRARVNSSSHIEEVSGVAGLGEFFLGFEGASDILPNGLWEPEFGSVIVVIARGFEIKGSFAGSAAWERATALEGDGGITEVIEIFRGIEELVNEALESLGGDDNGPSDFLLITKDIAAEDALDSLFDEAIVAIEVVETAFIGIREQETADEVTDGDLPGAELGFKERFAVSGEGMEKDLAIGGLNEDIHIRRGEKIIGREDARLVITGDGKARDARVLGRRGIR